MGVPNVIEKKKIGSETRADDTKTMRLINKIRESLSVNLNGMNKMTIPNYSCVCSVLSMKSFSSVALPTHLAGNPSLLQQS